MALNEQRFHILVSLARGPLHGYGIAEEISSITNGESRPRPGSLYHALDKLVEQDLVAADREEVVDGRLRRYYRLTEHGTKTLTQEAIRRQRAAEVALDRLGALDALGGVTRLAGGEA